MANFKGDKTLAERVLNSKWLRTGIAALSLFYVTAYPLTFFSKHKNIPKAYAQQNTLEDIASSEPLNYVVQKYDLNDGTLTTTDIGKRLANNEEILQYFTRFSNGLKDSLLGLVSGDTDKIYFNDTDSLKNRIDVTGKIKNLIGFEPQEVRVAKWSKDNNIRHLEIWIQPFYQNAKKSNRNKGIRMILGLT